MKTIFCYTILIHCIHKWGSLVTFSSLPVTPICNKNKNDGVDSYLGGSKLSVSLRVCKEILTQGSLPSFSAMSPQVMQTTVYLRPVHCMWSFHWWMDEELFLGLLFCWV